jgi:hypothetical protein
LESARTAKINATQRTKEKDMKNMTIDRRKFLKNAGLGSVALASLPGLGHALAADKGSDNNTNWVVAAIEPADTVNGIQYVIAFEGCGFVNPGMVVGQGSFVEFDNLSPVPHTILASGTWKATSLISTTIIGTYGAVAAGIIEMEIKLVEDLPIPGVVVPGVFLHITCNIPAAGLFNDDEEEGFELTIPDSPSGTFKPPVFVGGTVFSILNEKRGG